jgi:hypothetical protein
MGEIWNDDDNEEMLEEFGVDCIYFQARQSSQLKHGVQRLDSDAILGFHYEQGVGARLIRTAVSYQIINSEEGRIYKGGARFTIPQKKFINGAFVIQNIYERVFIGDIIAVMDKPIRDFDILQKGKRDTVFAFDITKILSITYSDATKQTIRYAYNTDYTLKVNNVDAQVVVNDDGTVTIVNPETVQFGVNSLYPVTSQIQIVWLLDGVKPPENEQYVVEFLSSPNYIVYDNLAKARGTHDNDLPKMIMSVKRAFVNMIENPIDQAPLRQQVLEGNDASTDEEL